MKKIAFEGEEYFLITDSPDWETPIQTEFELPGNVQRGWDGRESRRATGETLRLRLYSYATWMEDSSLADAVAARTSEQLLVPLWPCAQPTDELDAMVVTADLYVTFQILPTGDVDPESYVLHRDRDAHGVEVTPSTMTAAVVVCDWEDGPPVLELLDDEGVQVELSFREVAGSGLVFEEDGFISSLEADGVGELPIFHWAPDWSGSPSLLAAIARTDEGTGQGRETVVSYHGDRAKERTGFAFEGCELEEVAALLAFLQDRRGVAGIFWFPRLLSEGRIKAHPAPDKIELETPAGVEVGEVIALSNGLDLFGWARVTEVDGTMITVDEAIVEFLAKSAVLSRLVLGRFARPVLTAVWDTDRTARVSLEIFEVRDESEGPDAGEETVVSIYEFRTHGGEVIERLTSHESAIAFEGAEYVPGQITHSAIQAGLALDDRTTLQGDWRVGPMRDLFQGNRARVWVTIRRVQLDGTLLRTFIGELHELELEGRRLAASVSLLSRDLTGKAPRVRFQRPCNWAVFSEGCTLDEADWTWEGTVDAVNGREITVSGVERLHGAPAELGEDYFSHGFAKTAEGARCLVVSSTAEAGGALALTLGGGELCPTIVEGATISLVTGCDGRKTTCQDKFANYDNFGGHEVAAGNLSLVRVSQTAGGGKKG